MDWVFFAYLAAAVWIGFALGVVTLVLMVSASSRAPSRPSQPVADNLGHRVRTLIENGTFDAQIERAIQRNAKRRG